MLRPKRRLFRRRATSAWINDYAYAGVTLLALAGAAVAWGAIFDDERPVPGYHFAAPPEPAASVSAQAQPTSAAEPSAVIETSAPASSAIAPATVAEPIAATPRLARQGRVNSRSRAVARPHRRALASSVGPHRHDHATPRLLSSARRTLTPAAPRDVRAHEEPVDRAYVASSPAEARPAQQDIVSSPARAIERARSSGDCSRLSHTFGGMRTVRAECSSDEASSQ